MGFCWDRNFKLCWFDIFMMFVDMTLCYGGGRRKICFFLVDRSGEVISKLFLTVGINAEIGGLKSAQ